MKVRELILISALIVLLQLPVTVFAAPSGEIYFPEIGISSAHNILEVEGDTTITISFKNTAGADVTDVASTIQYITIAAANLDPTRTSINPTATWEIYVGATLRTSGSEVAVTSSEIYSPYSTTLPIELYIWRLGPPNSTLTGYTDSKEFNNDLRILRPSEILNFTVTIDCLDKVGDSVIWFFFKASEDEFEGQPYPTSINQIVDKCNLFYSKLPGPEGTRYWLPLHNSYDPYDSGLGTGHSFNQHSWIREPTTHAFAKADKHVHQKEKDTPPADVYAFHICGMKFLDVNRNGVWEIGIDQPINEVKLWLLAKTYDGQFVPADGIDSPYYNKIKVIEEHGNPVLSGEEGETLPGLYCFNLNVTEAGAYEFYIWLDESTIPANYNVYPAIEDKSLIINATFIGPIILKTGENEVSYDNDFANYLLPTGGIIVTTPGANNQRLNSYIPLIAVIGTVGAIYIIKSWKKRRH